MSKLPFMARRSSRDSTWSAGPTGLPDGEFEDNCRNHFMTFLSVWGRKYPRDAAERDRSYRAAGE
jgi:hypothetical protein